MVASPPPNQRQLVRRLSAKWQNGQPSGRAVCDPACANCNFKPTPGNLGNFRHGQLLARRSKYAPSAPHERAHESASSSSGEGLSCSHVLFSDYFIGVYTN